MIVKGKQALSHKSRRFPRRRKSGRRMRKRIPRRAKPDEKEKVSAQWPRAEGTTPPPRENPITMTSETETVLSRAGKARERIVRPTGNRQATEAA